ncbi:MAG TPA: SdpI family protein [Fimbriimonadaceae bacterium]|jgi:uncharacterized membrane protein
MKMSTALALCLLLSAAVCGYTYSVYSGLPAQVPTHWNAVGKIDGYGPKGTLFLLPGMSLMGALFLVVLPFLSPKNFTIDTFRTTFNYIMVIVSAMLSYLGVVIVYATAHPGWDLTKPLISGILLFIGLLGNFLGRVQKNFFVGIRTPWTLASDKVWVATHRLGARVMTIGGILGAIAVWIGAPPMVCMFAFMAVILYPVLFSFMFYKKLEKTQTL